MMAYNKYPTSFNTYKEFREIVDSIPEEDCMEWAENLDPNLLWIKNKDGWTVAHGLAWSGTLPERFITEELLRMKNNNGRTVALALAQNGTLPEKFVTDELLRMKTDYGSTIAHELAGSGTLPEKFITDELLRVKCGNGWTVAHVLAELGTFPKELITEELLRVKTDRGLTVAHSLAEKGALPEEFVTEELLRIKDKRNRTVAHELAKSGTLPKKWMTDRLLRMEDGNGDTTAWYFYIFLSENSRWDLLTPMLLDVPYNNSNTLVITKLDKDLSGMSDSKLEEALSVMSGETRAKLLSDIKNPDLLERIRKCIDRETENEIFEMSPDGDNTDPASGGGRRNSTERRLNDDDRQQVSDQFQEGQESLYSAGRGR